MINIRKAIVSDAKALSHLAIQTFQETFGHLYPADDLKAHLTKTCSDAFFRKSLAEPEDQTLLAFLDHQLIGYVKAGSVILPINPLPENALEIHRLYILKPYQARGYGHSLMDKIMEIAPIRHAQNIYLGVWEHNDKARTFYSKYGFEAVGEYSYYVGKHADREIIMKRQNKP